MNRTIRVRDLLIVIGVIVGASLCGAVLYFGNMIVEALKGLIAFGCIDL